MIFQSDQYEIGIFSASLLSCPAEMPIIVFIDFKY